MGDWDFTRGVAGLAVLVEYAEEHGVTARRALAGTGVTAADLADPAHEVTARQELEVVRNLHRAGLGGRTHGIEVGRRYHVSVFGIAGYALLSSRTLLDAMNFALRHLDLTFAFASPRPRLAEGRVIVEVDPAGLPDELADFLAARDLVAVATVLGEIFLGELPVQLEVARGRLRFAESELSRPMPQANPATQALCAELCRDLARRRRDGRAVTQQVRVQLMQRLSVDPSAAGVAAALAVSERTLRRRLASEGTSFQEQLDLVRADLADRLLRTGGLTVDDVAQRLGYAEASSFVQAHRRWHGIPPRARSRS